MPQLPVQHHVVVNMPPTQPPPQQQPAPQIRIQPVIVPVQVPMLPQQGTKPQPRRYIDSKPVNKNQEG